MEVVFSLDRQNKLISGCHSGVGKSLTSQAQSAHFGRDKMLAVLKQRWENTVYNGSFVMSETYKFIIC